LNELENRHARDGSYLPCFVRAMRRPASCSASRRARPKVIPASVIVEFKHLVAAGAMRVAVNSWTVALTSFRYVVDAIQHAEAGNPTLAIAIAEPKHLVGCWCDEACCNFFDCCADKFQACGGCQIPGRPFCIGFCGRQSPGGCWCDKGCCERGDCCQDIYACGFCIPADITGDGIVNVADLLVVVAAWGPCPTVPQECAADIAPCLQGDQSVNVADLLMVITYWG
jgi:hypothetical protein